MCASDTEGPNCLCPDWQVLVAFSLGRLSDTRSETIEGHLNHCTACSDVLAALDGITDSFSDEIRRCAADTSNLSIGDLQVSQLELPRQSSLHLNPLPRP